MTPFTADGDVDHDSLRQPDRAGSSQSGSHGISIGGSTGEPSAQTHRGAGRRHPHGRRRASPTGCRSCPAPASAKLDETLELTGAARDAGADAALIITPYYARPTQEALYVWYKTVADEFPDLPIVAYNVPSRTAVDIAPETVARLFRDVDNFVGIKETTKDFEHFSRVLHAVRAGPAGLVAASSCSACRCSRSAAPASSARPPTSPRSATPRCTSCGRPATSSAPASIHYGLHPLVDLLFVETNPAPGKWVLEQRGLIALRLRAAAADHRRRMPASPRSRPSWPRASSTSPPSTASPIGAAGA